MKKSSKNLLLLFIILIVLIGAYIGIRAYSMSESKAAASPDIIVGNLSEPVSFTYNNGKETLSFYKEGNIWYDKDAPDFPLDQTYPVAIASNIQLLIAIKTINLKGNLNDFGLEKPAITLSATDKNAKTVDLLIGNGADDYYYVMEKGGNKIYTIHYNLVSYLQYDMYHMIMMDTFNVYEESKLTDLTITYGGNTLSLIKEGAADASGIYTWDVKSADGNTVISKLSLPKSTGTDQNNTQNFDQNQSLSASLSAVLSGIEQMFFDHCINYKVKGNSLNAYGLGDPFVVLKVSYKDSNGVQKSDTLKIGAPLEDKSGYYAMLNDSTAVNVLDTDNVTPLINAVEAMSD